MLASKIDNEDGEGKDETPIANGAHITQIENK